MIVTATEFKTNFGKYLELIAKEDVFITRNGKILTNEDIACGQARHYPGGPGLPPGTNSGPPRL